MAKSDERLHQVEALLAHAGCLEDLARRLVGPSAAADLVQDTYVAALASQPDPRGSLRPWLATVLRRLGRDRLQAESARRERERRAARDETTASSHELVGRAEVQRLVLDAVLALNDPYRETVLLRYFERLSAAEIARRQRVPAATVRSRLARGLEQVRAWLDEHHGGDGVTWLRALSMGIGPAAMPAGALGVGLLSGLIVMKSLTASVAVLVLALGWYVLREPSPAIEPSTDGSVRAVATAALATIADASRAEPASDHAGTDARSPLDPKSATGPVMATPGDARLVGRFLLPGGAPAADVYVQLACLGVRARGIETRYVRGMSAADGTFDFAFDPGQAGSFLFTARLEGYGPLDWRWPTFEPKERRDLGDVQLSAAATVVARLVDDQGAPLNDGWQLVLEDQAEFLHRRESPDAGTGEARFEGLLAGRYRVRARAVGDLRSVPNQHVDVAPGETARVVLAYTDDDSIVVTVDHRSAYGLPPSPGAFVLRGEGLELRFEVDASRAEREHVFRGLAPGEYTVELEDERFEPWIRSGLRPGARPIAELRGTSGLVLEVVERESGRLVPDYELITSTTLHKLDPSGAPAGRRSKGGPSKKLGEALPEGGLVDNLVAGEWSVAVTAPGYVREEVTVQLPPREHRTLRIELEHGACVEGRLLDALGGPLAKASIQLVPPEHGPLPAFRLRPRPPGFGGGVEGGHATSTDAAGRFVLDGLQPGTFALHGFLDRWLSATHSPLVLSAGEKREVLLTLPAAATLRGRVRGSAAPAAAKNGPQLLALYVEPAGRPAPEGAEPIRVEVTAEGTFRSGPLPPGPVVLSVAIASAPLNAQGRGARQDVELQRFELHEGEEHEVELDLAAHWPGELVVRLSGAPGYHVLARRSGAVQATATAAPDTAGVARLGPLLPGDYELIAFTTTSNGVVRHPGSIALGAGERIERALHVEEVPGTLRLLDAASGAPLAGSTIWISGGAPLVAVLVTDADGCLELELPPARYSVEVGELGKRSEPIELNWTPTGPEPATLDFRL